MKAIQLVYTDNGGDHGEARISSGPLRSLSFPPSATCILSVPSREICACFIGPMKCVNLISRYCGRINMHRAARARSFSPRSDLCAITHLLERRRIPLTEDGQRFRYCPDEGGGGGGGGETIKGPLKTLIDSSELSR